MKSEEEPDDEKPLGFPPAGEGTRLTRSDQLLVPGELNIEDLYSFVGSFGCYQRVLLLVLCVLHIYLAMQTVQIVFAASVPKELPACDLASHFHHHLNIKNDAIEHAPPNTTSNITKATQHLLGQAGSAEKRKGFQDGGEDDDDVVERRSSAVLAQKCRNYVYSSNFYSISVEWGLTGKNLYQVKLAEMALMAGVFTGTFLFGVISDVFGRVKPIFFSTVLCGGAGVVSAWTSTYWMYVCLQAVSGLGGGGINVLGYSLAVELVGGNHRVMSGVIYKSTYAFGIMIVAGVAAVSESWRYLTTYVSVIGLLVTALCFLLPESPRWLVSRGRLREAENVLRKIAKCNGKDLPVGAVERVALSTTKDEKTEKEEDEKGNDKAMTTLLLLTHRELMKRTMVMIYLSFCVGLTHYLLILTAQDFGENLYINEILLAIFKLFGSIISLPVIHKVGCKKTLSLFTLVASLTSLILFFLDSSMKKGQTGMASVGMLAATVCIVAVYLYAAELYPTPLRGTGVGMTAAFIWIGGTASPMVAILYEYYENLDYAICAGILLAASGAIWLLPDTHGEILPEKLEDITSMKYATPAITRMWPRKDAS